MWQLFGSSATVHSDVRVWWISSCMKNSHVVETTKYVVWRFEGLFNQMYTALHDFHCRGFHWRKFSLMDAYVWEFQLVKFLERSNLPEFHVTHIFCPVIHAILRLGVNYS